MLDTRSYSGQYEAHAQSGKPEWQGHHQKAQRGDDCRQDQGCSRADPSDHAVARYLQAAHGSVVEGSDRREAGVRQAELRLPYRQQRVELVRVTIVENVREAGADHITALIRRAEMLFFTNEILGVGSRHVWCSFLWRR